MSDTLYSILGRNSTLMAKLVRKGTRWTRAKRAIRKADAAARTLTDEQWDQAKASYARLLLRKHVAIANDGELRRVLSGSGDGE